jgi:hypothetical protein
LSRCAAALAATDAALASPVIMDERIPRQLHRIIDVESGLNDGLATPLALVLPGRCRGQRWPGGARHHWSTRWSSSPSGWRWA